MKSIQRSHRAHSRGNHSLLMAGIAILDCGFLIFIVFVFGLLLLIGH
jgi:hypothetical protein